MKRMKKALGILVAGTISVGCIGCGDTTELTETKEQAEMPVTEENPATEIVIEETEEVVATEEMVVTEDVGTEEVAVEEVITEEEATVAEVRLNNTYTTRYGKVHAVSCPTFQFDYPDNWIIDAEEMDDSAFSERVIFSNGNGATVTYMDYKNKNGLGSDGRMANQVEVTKVSDSGFIPGYPVGTDTDYSYLGKFVVAKIKIISELYLDSDGDYTPFDGATLYAVVPESYIGTHEVVGWGGMYTKFSFEYPSLYTFIAEHSGGTFTPEEEREVIAILSSFRCQN